MSLDETFRKIIAATRAKKSGKTWRGHCPAHDDENPSMSAGRSDFGHIWVKCHAGCSTDQILYALGLSRDNLYQPKNNEPEYFIENIFDYRDEAGVLLYQVIRQKLADSVKWPKADIKKFTQRRPDPSGNWIYKMRGVRYVPYRLPELIDPKNAVATVWIVEGEKCVDALRAQGLLSTCNPMGANRWFKEYSEFLTGRDVVIIPDNDPPGIAHAQSVAAKTYGKAREIRIINLWEVWKDMPEKGDVYNWLEQGHDGAELCNLAEAAPVYKPYDAPARAGGRGNGGRGNGGKDESVIDTTLSKITTAQSILRTDYPEPRWAVKGIIPEGATIIAGPPKLGKSVFCLNIAVAVAEGGKALSYFDVEQGSVLYLALEDSERRIKTRLTKLLTKPISGALEVVTRWPRLNEGGLEAIEEWILRHAARARLIIVDTFKRIRPLKGSHHKNATTYDVDYDDVVPLTDLTIRNCVALTLVAHTRKQEAEDVLAMISGSYGLSGAADGALILGRKRNSKTATLSVIGRDVEEQELALEFNPDMFMWSVLGKSSEIIQSNERAEILELFDNSDEALSPFDIASALNRKPGAIRYLLWKMKAQGQVIAFGRKYQAPGFVLPGKQAEKKEKQKGQIGQMALGAEFGL